MSGVKEQVVTVVVKQVAVKVVASELKRHLPKLVGAGLAKRALKGGVVVAAASAVVTQGEHVVDLARGRITTEQWKERAVAGACEDGLAFAGGALGGAVGTALMPGVGTVVGSTLGSLAGGAVGAAAGKRLGREVASRL